MIKMQLWFDQRPKDLVYYENLVESIQYQNYENPKYRGLSDRINKKSLKASKHFGLFLIFLAMSAQRNTTVREIKFKDFYKKMVKTVWICMQARQKTSWLHSKPCFATNGCIDWKER